MKSHEVLSYNFIPGAKTHANKGANTVRTKIIFIGVKVYVLACFAPRILRKWVKFFSVLNINKTDAN